MKRAAVSVGGAEAMSRYFAASWSNSVDRASGIEVEKVWAVNPEANRIALDALNHHLGHTHPLVGVFRQAVRGFIPQAVVVGRGHVPNTAVLVHEEYPPP